MEFLELCIPAKNTEKQYLEAFIMNLEGLCTEVIATCKKTGSYILNEQQILKKVGFDSKGINDFVTHVDKGAEEMLVKEFKQLIPDSCFLTEEKTVEQEDRAYRWIIDPIDGTTNFIHAMPFFCISVGLQHEGETILGVIYDMSRNECFYAVKDDISRLNGSPISVSDCQTLKDALLVTGFPYKDEGKLNDWMHLFQHFVRSTHGIRRLGSAALDLAYVACGRFEAFYEYGLSPWDIAAGAFIVKQAGGKVSDYSGGDNYLFGKELLAGNGAINDELRSVINAHFNR